MGSSIYDYATSEASSSTTGGWNTAENQDPSTVNDGMRAHKQNVAKFLKDLGGTITTTGSANAHAATLNQPIATTVPTGFAFKVKWGYTNTSSTVNLNLNSIGNARVKVNYGGILADPIPGDIQAGAYGDIIFDGTYHVLLNPQQRAPYPSGHLYGLTLSNNGSDATNDIDIAVGGCRDSTDAANMDLASALTKRLDAAWAVGTNQGMLDGTESVAGTPDTSTWYYIWLIKRPDTGVVDVLASESATAPTMPTNYTLKRRIGAVYNNSSGDIRAFVQRGHKFLWKTIPKDGDTTIGTTAANVQISVPVVSGIIAEVGVSTPTANTGAVFVFSKLVNDPTLSGTYNDTFADAVTTAAARQWKEVCTDDGAVRVIGSAAAQAYALYTFGWTDPRGTQA